MSEIKIYTRLINVDTFVGDLSVFKSDRNDDGNQDDILITFQNTIEKYLNGARIYYQLVEFNSTNVCTYTVLSEKIIQ